jgi:hypothetical protein
MAASSGEYGFFVQSTLTDHVYRDLHGDIQGPGQLVHQKVLEMLPTAQVALWKVYNENYMSSAEQVGIYQH